MNEAADATMDKTGKACLVEPLLSIDYDKNIKGPQYLSSQLSSEYLFIGYRNTLQVIAGADYSELTKTLTFSEDIRCFLFVEIKKNLYVVYGDELSVFSVASNQEVKLKFSKKYAIDQIFTGSKDAIMFADTHGRILELLEEVRKLLDESPTDLKNAKLDLFPNSDKRCAPPHPRNILFDTTLYIHQMTQNNIVLKCRESGLKTNIHINGVLIDVVTLKNELNMLFLKQLPSEYVITLLQYPDMTKLYDVSIAEASHLIGGIGNSMYFAQLHNSSIKLCRIKQMTPYQNLQCLIETGSYSEAEELALKHGILLEDVYKLKIKHLLSDLSEIDNTTVEEFIRIISKLNDTHFIYTSGLKAIEMSLKFAPLLSHMKTLKLEDSCFLNIDEITAKFDIYSIIPHVYKTKVTYFKWQYFMQCSFLDVYKNFLSSYKFDLATSAFLRSSGFIKKKLTVEYVSELLYSLPTDAKIQDLFIWLGNTVPFIVTCNPYFTDVIAKWSIERVHTLEVNRHWPKIGVSFADKIISYIKPRDMSFIPPSLQRLYFIKSSLTYVLTLKTKYNVKNITFKDFITTDHYSIGKAILHRTFTEDLKKVLNEFLVKFMREHGVVQDQLIKDHIVEQLNDNFDERRLEILLEFVYDVEIKANSILEILQSAPIPWSKTIEAFASVAINICPRIAKKVQVEMLYTKVKCCLLKYDISDFDTDTEIVIMRIISKELPEMSNDIETIVSVYKDYRDFAYFMSICKYIQTNKMTIARATFNKLSDNERKSCQKSLMLQLESLLLSHDSQNLSFIYFYIDFLRCIDINDAQISIFEKCINLKLCYDLRILPADYHLDDKRNEIFAKWCRTEIARMLKNSGIQKCINRALNLAKCLNFDSNYAVEKILENFDSDLTYANLHWIMNKASSLTLNLSKFISSILKVLVRNNIKLASQFIELLKWIVSKHIVNCSDDLSRYACIAGALNSLTIISETKSKHIFSKEKDSKCESGNLLSLPMLKERLDLLTEDQSKYSLNTVFFISKCWKNLSNLGKEINIIGVLSEAAVYTISHEAHLKNYDSYLNIILRKLLGSKQQDCLVFSTVLKLHSSPAVWLSNVDANYTDFSDSNKRNAISSYISKVSPLFGKSYVDHKFNILTKCQNLLSFFDKYSNDSKFPDFDDVTQAKPVILQLFSQNVEHLSIDMIEELCSFTGLSRDEGYTFYLFSVINESDVEFKIVVDHFETKHIILKNDEHDLTRTCSQIISKIKNREQLLLALKTFFKNGEILILDHIFTVNQYHYEVYLCILHLISQIAMQPIYNKDYMLLMFLKNYFRTSPPKNSEIDLYKFKGCFPEISYYRLPFQPFLSKDLWKSLKSSEINLMTYQQWLPVVALLPLNVDFQNAHDMVCSNAVKQSMAMKKNAGNNLTEWSLTLENDLLLKKAYDCVKLISKPEWATACLFYILQLSKSGADQVAAAALCYQFTETTSKTQPIITEKMRTKYIIANTMHILYKYDLADKSLLKLCDMPLNLIKELYNHPAMNSQETPAINKAVDEIAETYGLNKTVMKTEIFEEILNKSDKMPLLDETVDLEIHFKSAFLTETEIKRACYVFQSSTPVLTALHLSRNALDSTVQVSTSKRLKYLQCLLSIADSEILENVTNLSIDEIWSKIWELYFINAFQMLEMHDVANVFIDNKLKAFEQIWKLRSFATISPILFIIMKMAYVYNLKPDFTSDFIDSALKFELHDELRHFLTLSPSIEKCSLIKAYNELIVNPFEGLEDSFTGSQKKTCMLALKYLFACPLYNHLNLSKIWNKCIAIKHPEMASALLPFMEDKNKSKVIRQLGNNFRRLFTNLESMSSEYCFPIEVVKYVVKECITGE